jgi:hypothetical protein
VFKKLGNGFPTKRTICPQTLVFLIPFDLLGVCVPNMVLNVPVELPGRVKLLTAFAPLAFQ